MSDEEPIELPNHEQAQGVVENQIGRKEDRRLKARKEQHHRVWFGLGMFGLVGWSVAIPTLLGAAAGIWLDDHFESRQSWTLTLLLLGLVGGCLNAWRWLKDESEVR